MQPPQKGVPTQWVGMASPWAVGRGTAGGKGSCFISLIFHKGFSAFGASCQHRRKPHLWKHLGDITLVHHADRVVPGCRICWRKGSSFLFPGNPFSKQDASDWWNNSHPIKSAVRNVRAMFQVCMLESRSGWVELAVYTLADFRQGQLGSVIRVDGRTDEPEELVIKQQGFHHPVPSWWLEAGQYPEPS